MTPLPFALKLPASVTLLLEASNPLKKKLYEPLRSVLVFTVPVVTLIERFCDAAGEPIESVTCTVNGEVVTRIGIPVMVPLCAFRRKPDGNWPEVTAHVYGGTPPVATRVAE